MPIEVNRQSDVTHPVGDKSKYRQKILQGQPHLVQTSKTKKFSG